LYKNFQQFRIDFVLVSWLPKQATEPRLVQWRRHPPPQIYKRYFMVHCLVLGDQIGSHTVVSPRDPVSKSDLASEDLADIVVNGLRLTDIIAESTTLISGSVSMHFALFLSSTTYFNDK
jgi:hypothetical protein